MKIRFDMLWLRTKDQVGLKNFYEKLGLVFRQEKFENNLVYYAADAGGAVVKIFPDEITHLLKPDSDKPEDRYGKTRFGFDVANLDEIIGAINPEKVLAKPHMAPWGYTAVVRDPDGNTVYLYQKNKGKIGD